MKCSVPTCEREAKIVNVLHYDSYKNVSSEIKHMVVKREESKSPFHYEFFVCGYHLRDGSWFFEEKSGELVNPNPMVYSWSYRGSAGAVMMLGEWNI